MKAALDVHYESDRAVAACVAFRTWQDSTPRAVIRVELPAAAEYRVGKFYERELPCLLAVLREAGQPFESIVIDGYVHLRTEGGMGLGAHLYASLPYRAAVIGVAKNPLELADRFVPIARGRSQRPLYVSAIGCSLEAATRAIASMHGPYRIPTLLRIADRQAREHDPAAAFAR